MLVDMYEPGAGLSVELIIRPLSVITVTFLPGSILILLGQERRLGTSLGGLLPGLAGRGARFGHLHFPVSLSLGFMGSISILRLASELAVIVSLLLQLFLAYLIASSSVASSFSNIASFLNCSSCGGSGVLSFNGFCGRRGNEICFT